MTSRREFMSNAFGIALVTVSAWRIRAGRVMQIFDVGLVSR